jgi:CheY-like chemotaxis protein
MTTHTESIRSFPAARALRTVAVVSKHSHEEVLETVLDAGDYDVVLIESFAHAYSHIKQVAPQMVIVCLEMDDMEGYQVLSMLNMDSATARIPLVTYITTQAS